MKVQGKALKCGLVLILTAGVLSMGGVAFSADPVKLTFWHHEAPSHRVMAFQKAIDLFEKEHPNIKVKQEVVAWGDAWREAWPISGRPRDRIPRAPSATRPLCSTQPADSPAAPSSPPVATSTTSTTKLIVLETSISGTFSVSAYNFLGLFLNLTVRTFANSPDFRTLNRTALPFPVIMF